VLTRPNYARWAHRRIGNTSPFFADALAILRQQVLFASDLDRFAARGGTELAENG
jgi:hypothetical protein